MDYEALKAELVQISEIASSVPEAFRERCFEILLQRLLHATPPPNPRADEEPKFENPIDPALPSDKPIPIPSQIRVFMGRTNVTVEQLGKVLINAEDGLHFVKEPSSQKISQGQIEWSLLLALRNGMLTNSLAVDAEEVRSICQDKGFYDRANFAANFKRGVASTYYKGALENQGPAQQLTNVGIDALGQLVKTMAAGGAE